MDFDKAMKHFKKRQLEEENSKHYFFCIVNSKKNLDKVKKFLEESGIDTKDFSVSHRTLWKQYPKKVEAQTVKDILSEKVENLKQTSHNLTEVVFSQLPNIEVFEIVRDESYLGENTFDKNGTMFSNFNYSFKADNIEETNKQNILKSNKVLGVSEDIVSESFVKYLKANFTIEGDTFENYVNICISKYNVLFEDKKIFESYFGTPRYKFFENYARENNLKERPSRFELIGFEHSGDFMLFDKIQKSILKDTEHIKIEKIGLKEKLTDYSEYDNVKENKNYKHFIKDIGGINLVEEQADVDTFLSNTFLARDLYYDDEAVKKTVSKTITGYYFRFYQLQKFAHLDVKLNKFFESGEYKNTYINLKLEDFRKEVVKELKESLNRQ